MPDNSEFFDALYPSANSEALRDALMRRVAYVLASDEDSRDLVAVDAQSGSTIISLVQNGRVYALDPDDTTSSHDGTTILVSNDGKRYILDALRVPYSVLSSALTEPPESPAASIGDAYLLLDPGQGDWADLGPVVVLTGRGWESVNAEPGRLIYVEDEDRYYRVDADGNVEPGLGNSALTDASIAPSKLVQGLTAWIVQEIGVDTPPSIVKGVNYIVGASPSGAFVGHTNKIATSDDGIAWTFYQPSEGWEAYDRNTRLPYRFEGTSWISAGGAMVGYKRTALTQSGSETTGGSGSYTYSASTPPTTSHAYREDSVTLSYTARKSAALLEVTYRAGSGILGNSASSFALFRDSESNAIDWVIVPNDRALHQVTFYITAIDAAAHTYKVRQINIAAPATTRRMLEIKEYA